MARCLLLINTLDYTMKCVGWQQDQILHIDLSRYPHIQDIDIVPTLDTYNWGSYTWNEVDWEWQDYDRRRTFTPRGLIVAVAEYCTYTNSCRKEFFGQIWACPYEDMTEFIPCLYCEGTKTEDIEDLEDFIRDVKFVPVSDKLYSPMKWEQYADEVFCDPGLDINKDGIDPFPNIRGRAQGDATKSYRYTYTKSIKYPISNPPTPNATEMPSDPTQTAEDSGEEEDEVKSIPREVAAGTTKRRKAAPATTSPPKPTASSPAKNGTGRYAVVDANVLGLLSVVAILLLV
ncbi:hypothetical protein FVEG_14617 [Fusarium verticillioides 7600]|uniref:Uncharacterized protein n=1 Tax=Gibberella moniliformis (strain M3125 / FGSC 7600) TaxID=334819 RepID=W7L942_GIBM7|nr:hypothetical protein FVEG_14617 [Fusarium verticillioides 7600]EWG36098.1 hypothetical protein FVEG_14617 [Fusarium verticillioides 7600]